jgi:hypothetical protein
MQLPGPVRAFVGLLAVTADEARHLPDRAIELPMLAVSSALQMSLRAQQRYARLAARGDDVINRRPLSDEPPSWATFDDPVPVDDLRDAGLSDPDPALPARAASQLLDELLGVREQLPAAKEPAPARKAPATKPPARAAAAKNAPAAAKAQPRKAPAAKKAPVKKAPVKKVTAAKKATTTKSGKTINSPRHTTPSRFDTVDDD